MRKGFPFFGAFGPNFRGKLAVSFLGDSACFILSLRIRWYVRIESGIFTDPFPGMGCFDRPSILRFLGRVWILRALHLTIFTPLESCSFLCQHKSFRTLSHLHSFEWWLVRIHPLVTTNITTNPNWQNNGISQENSLMITCHPNKTNRNIQQHHPRQHHNTAPKMGPVYQLQIGLKVVTPVTETNLFSVHAYCWWFKYPAITSWYGVIFHSFQGFSTIPGGWPWDFRTINSRGFSLSQWTLIKVWTLVSDM